MLQLLIIDDSREDAILAQRVLEAGRILNPIRVLNSGQSCLDYFMAKGEFAQRAAPCLVFLDMKMDPITGLDVLRAIPDIPAAQSSVFVMLSALCDLKTINAGYQLGAHTFLMKPLRKEELMHTLHAIPSIHLRKAPRGFEISLTSQSALSPSRARPARTSSSKAAI